MIGTEGTRLLREKRVPGVEMNVRNLQTLKKTFAYSIPAKLLATALGIFMNKRIPAKKLESYLFFIIITLGVLLLIPHQ
ncbi:hypothetical protein AB1K18_23520 [Peribacillus simplex]|uniref:hypothetical protein n=1 Tax=Peribacillus simplex TaxID=1478 RepID=UPI003B8D91C6